jgi:DNA repair exonuclease SbcCD ATPase subunit
VNNFNTNDSIRDLDCIVSINDTIESHGVAINNNERIKDLIERVTGMEVQMKEANRRIIALTIEQTCTPVPVPSDAIEKRINYLRIRGDTLDKQKECDNLALRCEDLTKALSEAEQQSADWKRSFDMEQGNADGWYKTAQKWEKAYTTAETSRKNWEANAHQHEANSTAWERNYHEAKERSNEWEAKYHEMVKCRDQWRVSFNQADNRAKEWEDEYDTTEERVNELAKENAEWERRFDALRHDLDGTISSHERQLADLTKENERLQHLLSSINSLIQ